MTIKGVDLSYCQHGINYIALKAAGINFAIIRAGHGLKKDTSFEEHSRGVAAQGIKFGYYWFCESNTVAGVRAEAAKCAELLGTWYRSQEYPIFFDLEDNSLVKGLTKQQVSELALAFTGYLNECGYYCGIYANPDYLDYKYEKTMLLGKIDIWLAHYTGSENIPSKREYGQTMHQWGIFKVDNMNVDGDNCYIDYPARIAAWRRKRSEQQQQPIAFNRNTSVTLLGVPVYSSFDAERPRCNIIPDSTKYVVTTGLIENNRIQLHCVTDAKDTFFVDVACIAPAGNKTAKITYTDEQITGIARRVIKGEFGAGQTRTKLLEQYGYPVDLVQAKVNKLLFGK